MSRSKRRFVRLPARGYVEFFRDTPLLVQMLAIYWALTFLGADAGEWVYGGVGDAGAELRRL